MRCAVQREGGTMSDKKLDQIIREKSAPLIGLVQLFIVIALLAMVTVYVLRTLGGVQLSSVPRFDHWAIAAVAFVVLVLKL